VEAYDREEAKDLYENFYARKDFKHFPWADPIEIRTLVNALGLRGKLLADIGCGTGWYTELFRRNGVHAYGMDLAEAGICKAARGFGGGMYLTGDALALPVRKGSLDAVFLSGFPTYNTQELRTQEGFMRTLLGLLKTGGVLIFRKTTDLSGRKTTRMNHTLSQYVEHFAVFEGFRIERRFAANPLTWLIFRRHAMDPPGSAAATAFTKLSGLPLRATVVVRKLEGA